MGPLLPIECTVNALIRLGERPGRSESLLCDLNSLCYFLSCHGSNTVKSEIFARTLFSRNFAYAKFRENKTLTKWQNYSVVY